MKVFQTAASSCSVTMLMLWAVDPLPPLRWLGRATAPSDVAMSVIAMFMMTDEAQLSKAAIARMAGANSYVGAFGTSAVP